jgi:uncharacterized membrane protein YbhN (UPF0104 family)
MPIVVSVALLALLLRHIDFGEALDAITRRSLLLLAPALLAYTTLSLWLDAYSLVRVVPGAGGEIDTATAARIKAASYSFGLLHYALGAAALVVLVRRKGLLPAAEAAGVVMLISAFDLLSLLGVTAVGSALFANEAIGLRGGLVAALLAAAPVGLAVLRMERSLGPLDWLRELRVMRSVREMPGPRLVELLALRTLFVTVFIGLGGATLAAFGVYPPLGDIVVGFSVIALISALPIAVAGLGTGQLAFVYLFRTSADAATLVAASLALSVGIIVLRVALAGLFAREYAREALAETQDVPA